MARSRRKKFAKVVMVAAALAGWHAKGSGRRAYEFYALQGDKFREEDRVYFHLTPDMTEEDAHRFVYINLKMLG